MSTVLVPPVLEWIRQQQIMNTDMDDSLPDIIVDKAGNIYVTYMSLGTALGQTNTGNYDIVVFKMNAVGQLLWIRQQPIFNTPADETNPRIGIDANNNIYIAYLTSGIVSGGTTISGVLDNVIMKMNTNGTVLWIKQNEYTSSSLSGNINISLAITPAGTIYASYNTKGRASGGTQSGDDDIVVFKMNTDGDCVWIKQEPLFNTSDFDVSPAIAIDASENVYISYFTDGTTSGGSKTATYDIVVFKLNSAGVQQWIQQQPAMNSDADNREPAIIVSPAEDIYVGYSAFGIISGGSSMGGYDIVLFKMNMGGALQWIHQYPVMNTDSFELGIDLAMDASGNVYGTYMTDGTVSGGSRIGSGTNVVVFKMNPADGSLIWLLQQTAFNTDLFNGNSRITIDSTDSIYITFTTNGEVSGGYHSGAADIVVFKLRQHPFLPPPQPRGDCGYTHGPGTHESVRIRNQRECVEALSPPLNPNIDMCPQCRSAAPHGTRVVTTPSEHDRVLKELTRCPLYYRNTDTGGLCAGATRPLIYQPATVSSLLASGASTTPPYGLHRYRIVDRVRGIEDIAVVVRTTSASEVTARRRAAIQASARRHAEHFRVHPPPPPRLCRVIQQGPQAGVPIAPQTPCNNGNQRVDYSNPRA
jgi:hypothetical protein